jgi:hypothetical protein
MRTRMSSLRSRLVVALVGAGAMAAVGSVAYATIPDSTSGVIHSCYSQSLGTWRPIDYPTQKCKSGETQLDFNQRGPQGPTGPAGPAGKDGVSITSTSLAQGDPNCVNGGSRFDSASGTTYACNGTNGKDGAQGPPGPPGISNYQVVTAAGDDTTSLSQATARCPAGTTSIGGGAEIAGGIGAAVLFSSKPIPNGNGGYDWQAIGVNSRLDTDLVFHVNAFAICATAG